MTTIATRKLDGAATAKLVAAQLKEAFPGVKFRRHTTTGVATRSVTFTWTDGPTVAEVRALTGRFARTYFDPMADLASNREPATAVIDGETVAIESGVDYFFAERELSEAYLTQLQTEAARLVANFSRTGFYRSVASRHGVFTQGAGIDLLRWLSRHIAPAV